MCSGDPSLTFDGQPIALNSQSKNARSNFAHARTRIGTIEMIQFREQGFKLWLNRFSIDRDTTLRFFDAHESSFLSYNVQGDLQYQIPGLSGIPACENHFAMLHLPTVDMEVSLGRGVYERFGIELEQSYLKTLGEISILAQLFRSIERKEACFLNNEEFLITYEMNVIIEELKKYLRDSELLSTSLHIMALVLRLLDISLTRIVTPVSAEIKVMQLVRDHIMSHLGDNMNVKSLSDKFGINFARHRELFKSQYGSFPSDFIYEERMKRAVDLLTNSDLPIKEIAGMVGYVSAANFTTGFKSRFGVSPGTLRLDKGKGAMTTLSFTKYITP